MDAKAPLEAFLDAQAASDPGVRSGRMADHVRLVREHVTKLFGGAPEITWFDTPVIVDNAAPASKAA